MRAFRNAALAGATALAVTFGGSTVAVAEPVDSPQQPATVQGCTDNTPSSSAQTIFGIEKACDENDTLRGDVLFGKETNISSQGQGAKVFYALTIILGLTTVFGLIIAPFHNYLKYGR